MKISETAVGFKHGHGPTLKICALSIFLVLAISVIGYATNSAFGADSSPATCSTQTLDKEILDTGTPIGNQTAQTFTQSSSQYKAAISGFTVTKAGIGDEWSYNSSTCTVAWTGLDVNYLLQSSNGSSYELTIYDNPQANAVYTVSVLPQGFFSLYSARTTSTTYAGYAVADNSGHSTDVDYAQAYWTVPTVYNATTVTCGNSSSMCETVEWAGLQNSTYDGGAGTVNGEVIQTGTGGYISGCPSSCSNPTYFAFGNYLAGSSSGHIYNGTDKTQCLGLGETAGDSMTAVVGSQLEINGTSGDKFYTLLSDSRTGKICEYKVVFSDSSKFTNHKYGTEYYADFIVERPQNGATSWYHLSEFTTMYFDDMEMGSSGTQFGAYPNENLGYGFASYMYNSPYINAQIGPWVLNTGSTTFADFNVTYSTSAGT